MPRREVRTDAAPPPSGAYSQGIRAGDFLFLSGQGPFRPDGSIADGSFEEQARQTFSNLAAVAAEAGGSMDDVVRFGVYLRDMADFETMNDILREFVAAPLPTRTTIPVSIEGMDIEVDAVLYLGE